MFKTYLPEPFLFLVYPYRRPRFGGSWTRRTMTSECKINKANYPNMSQWSPFVSSFVTDIMTTTFVNNALLLATLPNLFVPHFLTQVIAGATTQTRNRLVIVFFSRHFNTRS